MNIEKKNCKRIKFRYVAKKFECFFIKIYLYFNFCWINFIIVVICYNQIVSFVSLNFNARRLILIIIMKSVLFNKKVFKICFKTWIMKNNINDLYRTCDFSISLFMKFFCNKTRKKITKNNVVMIWAHFFIKRRFVYVYKCERYRTIDS